MGLFKARLVDPGNSLCPRGGKTSVMYHASHMTYSDDTHMLDNLMSETVGAWGFLETRFRVWAVLLVWLRGEKCPSCPYLEKTLLCVFPTKYWI